LIDETQARIDLRTVIGQQGAALEGMIPKIQALMAASNDPSKVAGLQAMIDKIKEMQAIGAQQGWMKGMEAGLNDYAIAATDTFTLVRNATKNAFKGMEDALVSFVTTGKLDFKSLTNSIIADMVRMSIRQSITKPLATMAMSFFTASAKGNVFDGAGLSAYSNSIVSSPTVFPFARGVGLMGEAGPEAIMPLKRGPDGTLGVRGGGGNVQVNIINQASGTQAQTQERSDGNGNKIIDVLISQVEGAMTRNLMSGAGMAPAMERRYGLNPAAGAMR
jgi:phage-related minor tail protein